MTGMMRSGAAFGILIFALWIICAPLAGAQEPGREAANGQQAEVIEPVFPTAEIAGPISAWDAALNRIGERLESDQIDQDAIGQIRDELTRLRSEINAYSTEQQPRLPELEARLDSLGEAPAEGEPPEPQPVAQQRAELRQAVGDLRGALKGAEEALVRVDLLNERARERRRTLFETQVLQRGQSPLSPGLWRNLALDAPVALSRLESLLERWWSSVWSGAFFVLIVFLSVVVWGGLSWLAYQRIEPLRRWAAEEPPNEWERAASAGQVILLRMAPAVVAGGFLYFGLSEAALLSPRLTEIVVAAITSLIIVTTVQAVIKTALAINRPHWRLLNLSHEPARQLYLHLMVLAVVYGVDFFISAVTQAASMPFTVSIVQSFLSAVIIAGLILSILRIREPVGDDAPRPIGPSYVRLPLWIIALLILGAALIGYVALARFIAGQLIVTSTILIVAYLLIISISAFGHSIGEEQSAAGSWFRDRLAREQRTRERLALPIMLGLKSIVILAVIPFVLLLWGFDWHDIAGWLQQALFGFEVGGVRISVTAIVVALVLFGLGYMAARFFQEWLDGYVLQRAGVDDGVRNSVRTGVGYLGVVLAALLAISYLGLDFSNLAIVAGALSVGVGFGLQSIVNNFVSGLILLAERPIKAGDWIIAGGHEGIVRKISVRSTEIETFDRANVVVPNSMLISDTVKNWTLHNSTGRMPIPVGVHYDSDPEQVRDILLEVANAHPHVLSNPAPFVYFDDFADSSLNFTLYVYLENVNRSFSARTDLRIAVLKAFREKGVEIPYPQTDVHLRDLDWLKRELRDRGERPKEIEKTDRRDYKSESDDADGSEGNGNGR